MATLTSLDATISCRLFSSVFSLYSFSLSIYKTFCLCIFIPKDSEEHRTTYKVALRKHSWFTDAGLGFSQDANYFNANFVYTAFQESQTEMLLC